MEYKIRQFYIKILVIVYFYFFIYFFLAVVASMTIKPTITVNGPRPTVAAVAAGIIHIIIIIYK